MNRFLKGAMILTLAGIIVKVIGAFSKVLIARILGGEGIGLYMMAYPIYQIIVSISAAGIPVAISIMIAEKLANDDMRGVQQVFSVSLRVLAILGLVFSLALYGSAQWLVDNQIITDPRALIAIQLLSPAIFVVTILSCFRGYFQGFQYMVPTGTSQVFEQIFRVSSMVGLAYYFIDRGLHLAAGGATFATFPGVLAGLLVLIYFYYRQRNVREKMLSQQNPNAICESNGTVVKRLFSLAIPVSMANIMLPMVSLIDTFIVPKRLMDIGYYLNEATTQFGYLTGMATSLIGLPIILTTSLAASLVPAVSEAHTQGDVHRIVKRAETAIKIANMFTIPACIGLCVLATPISQLIYATPHAGPVIAVISLSDLMTPWDLIKKRAALCAEGDMVIALYNPRSKKRVTHLDEVRELVLQHRDPKTPVGIVQKAGRVGQHIIISDLEHFHKEEIDMQTLVIIGNSQTYVENGKIITPRGYKL